VQAQYEMAEWPLVRVQVADVPEADETWAPWTALSDALDRGGPFAFVIEFPPQVPKPSHPPDRMKWLKASRPLFTERCRGIAYVMGSPEGVAHADHWLDGCRNAYACPVEVFGDPEAAVDWARERLG
jgi:hypothetical protein